MNPFDRPQNTPSLTKNPFDIGGSVQSGSKPVFNSQGVSVQTPSFGVSQSTPQIAKPGTPQFFPATLAKDIGQGVARTVASVGITAGNAPTQLVNNSRFTKNGTLQPQPLPFPETIDTSGSPITRAVFGGQPVQTVQKNISDTQKKLEPYIGKFGSNVSATPIVLGSIALDLSGFGGGKAVKLASDEIPEAFFKAMAKEDSAGAIEGTLRKIGMDETLAKDLAPKFAETKTADEAKNVLLDFGKTETPTTGSLLESGSSVPEKYSPKDMTYFRKLVQSEDGIPNPTDAQVVAKIKEVSNDRNYTVATPPASVATPPSTYSPGLPSPSQSYFNGQSATDSYLKTNSSYPPLTPEENSHLIDKVITNPEKVPVNEFPHVVNLIAVSKDPKQIERYLETTGVDKSQIPQMARVLSSIDSPKKVNNIIEGFDTTRAPAKKPELPPEIAQKQVQLELKKEAVSNSIFKGADNKLMVDREGRVRELGDIKNPTLIRKIEDRMAEAGVRDPAEFSAGVEDYLKQKKEVKQLESSFNSEKKQYMQAEKLKTIIAERTAQGRVATPQPDEIAKSDNFENIESLLTDSREGKTILDKELETIRSLPKNVRKEIEPLSVIIQKEAINVKQKITLLDYLRTPEKVLQKMGLGKIADQLTKAYDSYLAELPQHIDTITDWSKQIDSSRKGNLFDYLDGKPVQLRPNEMKVATEIQSYLKDWADRLGLPEDERIAYYITHIFEKDFIQKEFDPDLAKIIADKIPGQVYDPFLEQRLGKMGFVRDPWRALDAYTKRATRKANMDPVLDEIQKIAPKLEESQWNYMKRYVDRINMRPTEIDNLVDNQVKNLFGYKFGQRPVASITKNLRQMVFRGGIGLNVGSAFRNLSQGANTYSILGEKYTGLGYGYLMKNGVQELKDNGVLLDNFVEDRTINATKQMIQKVDKGLFFLFDTAEKINRGSAYFGAKLKGIDEGMSEEQAIDYAKKVVAQTQFRFSPVDTPVALQGDLIKVFTQFMTYPFKQTEFIAELAKSKSWGSLIRYLLGSFVIMATVGQLYGGNWGDIIPTKRFTEDGGLIAPIPKAGIDILQLFTGSKSKFGQPEDFKTRLGNVISDLTVFVPGGAQAKKTIQGLSTVSAGKDVTATGKTRYNLPQTPTNYVRAGIFGKYNFPQAQAYYNNFNKPAGSSNSASNPFNR